MRWLALSVVALSLACGGDKINSVPESPSIVGAWSLETIGGVQLPYLLDQIGEDKLELMEAGVTARDDGSFSASSTERTTISGVIDSQSYTDAGRFTAAGNTVTFVFDVDASVVRGTIDGNTLTFRDGPMPVVYRRK